MNPNEVQDPKIRPRILFCLICLNSKLLSNFNLVKIYKWLTTRDINKGKIKKTGPGSIFFDP